MSTTPGDQICILVDGQPVNTIIDDHGVQRFVENEVVCWLLNTHQIDLNSVCLNFLRGKFSLEDYMEFYMSLGYSVSGFEEVFGASSSVADNTGKAVEILNPLWESGNKTVH